MAQPQQHAASKCRSSIAASSLNGAARGRAPAHLEAAHGYPNYPGVGLSGGRQRVNPNYPGVGLSGLLGANPNYPGVGLSGLLAANPTRSRLSDN